jgi:hypothetical protein
MFNVARASLFKFCADACPQIADNYLERFFPLSAAQVAAEARVGCILINVFTEEQDGWRLNGFYEPTEERQSGRRVYVKHGDASLCLEFYKGFWRLKLSADKGKHGPCFGTCTNDFEYLQDLGLGE